MKYMGKDKCQNVRQSLLHSYQNGWVVADNLTIICDLGIFKDPAAVRSRNFYFFANPNSAIIKIRAERIEANLKFMYAVWKVFKELEERRLLSPEASKAIKPFMVPVLVPEMQWDFMKALYTLKVECQGVDICFDYYERNTTEPPFCILEASKLNHCGSTVYSRDIGSEATTSLLAVYDRSAMLISRLEGVIPEELAGSQYWRLCFRIYEPYLGGHGFSVLNMNLNEFIYYLGPEIKPMANDLFCGAIAFKPHPNGKLLCHLADIQRSNLNGERGT